MQAFIVEDAWSTLALYESRDMLSRLYEARHGRTLNSGTAHALGSHFAQGREYFRSASLAGALVRPLLLYYGVVALSRGLILFLDPMIGPDSISEGHGVKTLNWRHSFAKGIIETAGLQFRVTKGSFLSLLQATGNRERCLVRSGSSRKLSMTDRRWTRRLPLPGSDLALTLEHVLTRVPDLSGLMERVTGKPPECVATEVWAGVQGEVVMPDEATTLIELRIHDDQRFDATEMRKRLGPGAPTELRRNIDPDGMDEGDFWHLQLPFRDDVHLDSDAPAIRQSRSGDAFLVSPLPNGGYLSSLASLFAASFVLGMIVRYYPAAWALLTGRATGDHMFPVIRATDSLIEDRFPQLLVEELELP